METNLCNNGRFQYLRNELWRLLDLLDFSNVHKIQYREKVLKGTCASDNKIYDKLVVLSLTYAEPVALTKSELGFLLDGSSNYREVGGHYTKDVTINIGLRIGGKDALSFSLWGTDEYSLLMKKLSAYLPPYLSKILYYENTGKPSDIFNSIYDYNSKSIKENTIDRGLELLNHLVSSNPPVAVNPHLNVRVFLLELLMINEGNIEDLSYNFYTNKLVYKSGEFEFEDLIPNNIYTLSIVHYVLTKGVGS